MTSVHIKRFKIFKDRRGRMRYSHRETGQKIDLAKAPLGSAAFFTECAKITAIAEANNAKAPKVGTLGTSPPRHGATIGSAPTFWNPSATRPSTPSTRHRRQSSTTRPPRRLVGGAQTC
jgi:hypothetical protein